MEAYISAWVRWPKGRGQSGRETATACCQAVLRQTGSRGTEGFPFPALEPLPHVHLLHAREGCFGDRGSDAQSLQGRLEGW